MNAEDVLIILPVKNAVLFPGVVLPIAVSGAAALAAAQEAVRTQRRVGNRSPPTSTSRGERLLVASELAGRGCRRGRALGHQAVDALEFSQVARVACQPMP